MGGLQRRREDGLHLQTILGSDADSLKWIAVL